MGDRYSRGVCGKRAVEADGEFEHVVGVREDLFAGDRDGGWAGRGSRCCGLVDDASKSPGQGAAVARALELRCPYGKCRRLAGSAPRASALSSESWRTCDAQAQDRRGHRAALARAARREGVSVTVGADGMR